MLIPLAAAALCSWLPVANAQVTLKVKIPDGQKSTTASVVKVNQTLNIAGMDVVTGSTQQLTISSQNGQRGDDGKITVEQKIEALKADVEVAGQQLNFDFAKPDAPPPGTAVDVLLDIFKATAKSKWKVVYGQDNRVLAVEGRGDALKDLLEALQSMSKKQYDPEYLARVANDELAVIPTKPVKQGDTWSHENSIRLEGGQTMTFKTTYRYDGVVEQGGKPLHKITEKTTDVTYAMDADSPSLLKYVSSDLKVAESDGTTLFDNEAGQIVSESSKIKITGEIKFEANGNQLPAKLDLTFETNTKRQ